MTTPAPRPMTNALTNRETAEWVRDASTEAGSNRLEVVRVLREQCYSVLRKPFDVPGFDPIVDLRAEAILDTPIDKLAAMVVMSDTVMGNWRTIAETLVPVD